MTNPSSRQCTGLVHDGNRFHRLDEHESAARSPPWRRYREQATLPRRCSPRRPPTITAVNVSLAIGSLSTPASSWPRSEAPPRAHHTGLNQMATPMNLAPVTPHLRPGILLHGTPTAQRSDVTPMVIVQYFINNLNSNVDSSITISHPSKNVMKVSLKDTASISTQMQTCWIHSPHKQSNML